MTVTMTVIMTDTNDRHNDRHNDHRVFAGDARPNARLASNFKDIPNFASNVRVYTS